jgi:hypothetical protein
VGPVWPVRPALSSEPLDLEAAEPHVFRVLRVACREIIAGGLFGNKSIELLGILIRSAASLRDASAREVIRNHVDRLTYFATAPHR